MNIERTSEQSKQQLITGHTGLTALLGHPVEHSLSPLMHNEAFRQLGLDYVYLCFDVTEETLETAVRGLVTSGIRGFNLTMPNKNAIVPLADEHSKAVQIIGASNTIVNDDGHLIAHNTDGIGYMRSVADAGFDFSGKRITILGAGGAASAIAAQAALDGIDEIHIYIRPTSRFAGRTAQLAQNINTETNCHAAVFDLNDREELRRSIAGSALLLNGSSVGMAPNTDASLIEDATYFHQDLVVSDVIYEPRQTKLLKLAEDAGCRTFNGMFMLLYQGAEAFRLWTGKDMPTEWIKEKYFM